MESKKKILRSVLLIALGSSILAFGSYNFNYQNNVTEGGVLGLLLLVKNVFDISPSITNLIIDFSLFAIGSKFFGKKFLACSIFATFCFSVSYRFWESIGFLTPNFTNSMLVGVGVGAGIVLRGGGASGGDDVIALLGNKFTPLKVQHVYMLTDAIVLLMSLVYLDFKQIFFSIIAVCISGKLISVIYEYKNDGIDTKDENKEAEVLEKNGSLTV